MNNNQLSRYELIDKGFFDIYKKERYALKKMKLDVNSKEEYITCDYDEVFSDNFEECNKMYNCISRRKTRLFKKLLYWFYYITKKNDKLLIFGTLTFTDDVLKKTSKETRRRYVSRFLNNKSIHYVANIDFGKKDDREHYHFIALCNSKIESGSWSYGFDKYKKIKNSLSLRNRKNYLLKLTNHTYKNSTKQEKLITDRNNDSSLAVFICKNYEEFIEFKNQFYLDLFKK